MRSEAGLEVWDDTIRQIVSDGGVALLIGAPDTGKTTFCRRAALAAIQAGRRAAIVDADVGQSEIGPPACVSVAIADAPFERLSDLDPVHSAFVGAISPRYATLEHLAAVCRSVHVAGSLGAHLILCDTTGFARGPAARRLKSAKEFAIRPDHVIELTRRASRHPRADADDGASRPRRFHTLPVPACIALKPPTMRASRREHRFLKALEGSVDRDWPIESVRLAGTWIGSGSPLAAGECAGLSRAVRCTVCYAEARQGHLGMITTQPPRTDLAQAAARETYGALEVSVTLEYSLRDLLVGLGDYRGDLLALGRVLSMDYMGRTLKVATPTHSYGLVREIRFGLTRIDHEGRTLATLRPGDV